MKITRMKNIFIPLLLLVCSSLFAQTEEEAADQKKSANLEDLNRDRLIVEFNHNNWLNAPDSIKIKEVSRGFNFYLMYDFALGKSNFSIAPGIGLATRNIYHDAFIVEDTNEIRMIPIGNTIDYKKNKLTTTYLDVPLEFRFRTKPDNHGNSFKIAIGAKAGYLIGSHTKIKQPDAFGDLVKYKKSDIRHLNPFRYGGTFRIGYSDFNLIAFYSLATLFDEGAGPAMNPVSIGISFNGL